VRMNSMNGIEGVNTEIKNYQDKMERGFNNSLMLRQMKVQNIRELSQRKPDIEQLRKRNEDQNFEVWSRYLLKVDDKRKKLLVNKKKAN